MKKKKSFFNSMLIKMGIFSLIFFMLTNCEQLSQIRESIRGPLPDIISVSPVSVSGAGGYSSTTVKWQTNKSGTFTIALANCSGGASIGSGSVIGGEIKETVIQSASLSVGENSIHFCIKESDGGSKDIPFSLIRDDSVPILEIRNSLNAVTNGGLFTTADTLTLSCIDTGGAGCEKFVYTTNGSIPSFSPENGQVVTTSSTSLSLVTGNIRFRYKTQDKAGNADPYKEVQFIVSASTSYPGVLYIATTDGIARSYGRDRTIFLNVTDQLSHTTLFYDSIARRLYSIAGGYGEGSGMYIAARTDNLLTNARAWSQRSTEDGILDKNFNDIKAYGGYVYVATNLGISISKNYGDVFNGKSVGKYLLGGLEVSTAVNRVYVNFNQSNPDASEIYVATNEIGLVKSSNNGQTFSSGITAFGTVYAFKKIYDVTYFENKVYVLAKDDASEERGIAICAEKECQTGFSYHSIPELNTSGDYMKRLKVINRKLYFGSNEGLFIYDPDTGTHEQKLGFGTQNLVHSAERIGNTLAVLANNGVHICDDLVCTTKALKDEAQGLPGNITSDAVYVDTTLFTVGIAGLAVSTDQGNTYTSGVIGSGLSDNLVYAVRGHTDSGINYLYAPTRFGFSISQDGGGTFKALRTKDGLGASVTIAVDIDTVNKYVYIATNDGLSICTNLACTGAITTWFNGLSGTDSQGLSVKYISGKVFFGTKNMLHYCADYQCTTRASYATGFETHNVFSYSGQMYLSTNLGLRQCNDASDCDNISGYTTIGNAVPTPLANPSLSMAATTDNIYSYSEKGLAKTTVGAGVSGVYSILIAGLASPISGGKYAKMAVATDMLDVLGRRDYIYFPSRQGVFIHKSFVNGADTGLPALIEINKFNGLGSNNVYGIWYLP